MTRLLGISGALRKGSTNTGLLRALEGLMPAHVQFEIATLHGIPLFDGDEEKAHGKPPAAVALAGRVKAADAVIIATPEYNRSIPGVLKNATDWMSRGGSPFHRKPVGVIGAGGMLGTTASQMALRQCLFGLDATVMSKPEVYVMHNHQKFDAEGNLTDDETRQLLAKWLAAFLEWVEKKP